MRQQEIHKGQEGNNQSPSIRQKSSQDLDIVLEKVIFNNIFNKDIRRVYIYKKSERLAKAVHLIAPAFRDVTPLRERIEAISVGLVDAAILPIGSARTALSQQLLALSSLLNIARTSSLLSHMNADLISQEAMLLLQEIAHYEEPRLFFDDAPTLSTVASKAGKASAEVRTQPARKGRNERNVVDKGHDKNDGGIKDRREGILSVIKDRGRAGIKDISTIIRGVSEKTIQRELTNLINEGLVIKEGERRWSTYSLA